MRAIRWLLIICLAAGLACGDREVSLDAGQKDARPSDSARRDGKLPRKDKGKPGKDKAAPKKDKADPKQDKAGPKPDKAVPKPDKAVPKPDKKVPKPDKAMPKPDKKVPKPDKAMPKPDKAMPKPDKALPKPDKALPKPDKAPPKPDIGTGQVKYTGSFPKGKTGFLTATLTVGGYARTVRLYLPKGLSSKPPVMITFHGTNGNAQPFITSSYARTLADQKKVLIIGPEARKPGVKDWDHQYSNEKYWQTYPHTNPSTNPDLLLVQAIILEAQKAYGADPKRFYTLGHSNGGFFSLLAAMSLPTKIAGFAESSGGLTRCTYMWSCKFTGSGSANTCAALSKQAGYAACLCGGAYKPGPVHTKAPKPPGYLFHHTKDYQVSAAHTCILEARLKALGYKYKTHLVTDPYHSMPYNFAIDAWNYLSQYKLP